MVLACRVSGMGPAEDALGPGDRRPQHRLLLRRLAQALEALGDDHPELGCDPGLAGELGLDAPRGRSEEVRGGHHPADTGPGRRAGQDRGDESADPLGPRRLGPGHPRLPERHPRRGAHHQR